MGRELNDFVSLIRKKRQTIVSVVVVFLFIAIIVTFAQPLKYSSESRLLVVQNFPEDTDPYAISKSNEYLSSILSKIVASNLFYDDIMNSGFPIDKNYFLKNGNTKKEMKKWRKTVQSRAISDTGIIEINVYHPNKQQLGQIAHAVNFVLKSKHNLYHGAGDSVMMKIIDKPILSNWPTKPNILLNLFVSIFFAIILSFSYIYLFPEEKYNIKLWPRKKKKNNNDRVEEEFREEVREDINSNWQAIGEIIADRTRSNLNESKEKEDIQTIEIDEGDDVNEDSVEDIVKNNLEDAGIIVDNNKEVLNEEEKSNIKIPILNNIDSVSDDSTDMETNKDQEEEIEVSVEDKAETSKIEDTEKKEHNREDDRKKYFNNSSNEKIENNTEEEEMSVPSLDANSSNIGKKESGSMNIDEFSKKGDMNNLFRDSN